MAILSLDHVNVRTRNVAGTLAFFRDVLKMAVVPAPGMTNTLDGGWVLDNQGGAVVHVGSFSQPYPSDGFDPPVESQGRGSVHHVALNCTGYHAMRERLKSLDLIFAENEVQAISLRQLFVREPNGVLLELNFREG
jgi:catechol 2,3-dioxygenase-like lactoylglutathione lyase family enzyme